MKFTRRNVSLLEELLNNIFVQSRANTTAGLSDSYRMFKWHCRRESRVNNSVLGSTITRQRAVLDYSAIKARTSCKLVPSNTRAVTYTLRVAAWRRRARCRQRQDRVFYGRGTLQAATTGTRREQKPLLN